MHSQPLLLIQAGTPPEDIRNLQGDLSDWFRGLLGDEANNLEVVRVFEGETLPSPGLHRAAIITGSWSMVTDHLSWSEYTAQWIRDAMAIDMPLFGVCYGHQLMAHALGGTVDYHPAGLEIGCQEIELLPDAESDSLMQSLPPRFIAHLTHLQTVLQPPENAVALARSSHDRHQILRYGPNAISTQFHPEFTPDISAACIKRREAMLRSKGLNPEKLVRELCHTSSAQELMLNFIRATATVLTINEDKSCH
ncbi:glutamine amidotransferase [Pokkaliibacter plantistimulans]|uniref:Glutamine amidotransferase n=1 Tax=Proteobacteria bacterium 228 TaxID=2083153 RepID=A0A2S5KX01_9PROT|nr:glutamine amidotransferase [Pokkaliibacter plantistimulans]PPC79384.1 glutamine amidotransferase [Pokkaliibacter plantistimulans]